MTHENDRGFRRHKEDKLGENGNWKGSVTRQ